MVIAGDIVGGCILAGGFHAAYIDPRATPDFVGLLPCLALLALSVHDLRSTYYLLLTLGFVVIGRLYPGRIYIDGSYDTGH